MRQSWVREARSPNRILARSVRHDEVFDKMLIFCAPQASNFLLSRDQAMRLLSRTVALRLKGTRCDG
jgi:hypothetical protein